MKLTPGGKYNETHLNTAETFDVNFWNSQETKKLPRPYFQSEDKLKMIDL